jgi:hypothetical protein
MVAEIITTQKSMLADMKADREERTARQEATESNPEKMEATPEVMQSAGEHWEDPKEEVAMKSSGTTKKPHKERHLAAGRRN